MKTLALIATACSVITTGLQSQAAAIKLIMLTAGGVQVAVNGVNITTGTSINGYRPRTLTLNPATGMLYLDQESKNNLVASGVRMFDSTSTSPVTAPTEATTGKLDDGAIGEYTWSVQSGARDWDLGTHPVAFNPNFTTGGGFMGAVTRPRTISGGVTPIEEFVPQTAGRDWGELEEGTIASPLNDAARFATYNIGVLNTASGLRKGMAYLDRRLNAGGTLTVDRYVYFLDYTDTSRNYGLYVVENSTNVTGASNTTMGTRSSTSPGRVLDCNTAFAGLVPGIGDAVRDIAVRPDGGDEFDVYFLSYDTASSLTYLSAVRATLPAASGGWSWTQLDISGNAGDGINHLQLRDTVADIDVAGRGIAFSADGTKLYVASEAQLSTGNSSFDDGRFYIFEFDTHRQGTMIFIR